MFVIKVFATQYGQSNRTNHTIWWFMFLSTVRKMYVHKCLHGLVVFHWDERPCGTGPKTPNHILQSYPIFNALQCKTRLSPVEALRASGDVATDWTLPYSQDWLSSMTWNTEVHLECISQDHSPLSSVGSYQWLNQELSTRARIAQLVVYWGHCPVWCGVNPRHRFNLPLSLRWRGFFRWELTWVWTSFPITFLDESTNQGLVCAHTHSIAWT